MSFKICYDFVKKCEGGYNNIKEDKGGATNFGLSAVFLNGLWSKNKEYLQSLGFEDVSNDSIKNMREEQAKAIYKKEFYDKYNFAQYNEAVSLCFYDMTVNHGFRNATKIMQRALNMVDFANLTVDGACGVKTIEAIKKNTATMSLLRSIKTFRLAFYSSIIANNADQAKFKNGWENRANAMFTRAEELAE